MEVAADQNDGDREVVVTETQQVGDGIVCYDSWDEMRASWKKRSDDLMDEMASFGWTSVFAACAVENNVGNSSTVARMTWRGNYYAALGLVHDARVDLDGAEEDEDE